MKSKIIRITESDLQNMIKEGVRRVLEEAYSSGHDGNDVINKRSVINKLYRIVLPFTKHKYNDSGWQGVDDIINALTQCGYKVTVSVKDGGYRNSYGGNTLFAGDGNVSYWKEYDLEIPVGDKVINGRIRCHACGTIDDIFSSYDQTCAFW